MLSRLTLILSIFALLLGGCVSFKNLPPVETSTGVYEAQSIKTVATRTGRRDVAETANLVASLVELKSKERQLLTEVYQERADGSNYSEEMRRRLETLIKLNRSKGELSVPLPHSGYGKKLGRAVLRTAEVSDELYQLLLGYTIAGLEWNTGYLTDEKERYTNTLIVKQRKLMEAESRRLTALMKTLRAEARTPKSERRQPSPEEVTPTVTEPSIVITGGALQEDDKKLLRDALRRTATSSVLAKRPAVTLRVDVSQAEKTIGNKVTMVLFGFGFSGGDAKFSATLEKEGEKVAELAINTYEINAKDFDTLMSLVANRVVGAAHFALLRAELAS